MHFGVDFRYLFCLLDFCFVFGGFVQKTHNRESIRFVPSSLFCGICLFSILLNRCLFLFIFEVASFIFRFSKDLNKMQEIEGGSEV